MVNTCQIPGWIVSYSKTLPKLTKSRDQARTERAKEGNVKVIKDAGGTNEEVACLVKLATGSLPSTVRIMLYSKFGCEVLNAVIRMHNIIRPDRHKLGG